MKISNLTVNSGEKYFSEITVIDKDNRCATIPFFVINGKKSGPAVSITAGIHGTEYSGIEAALRLYKNLDPSEIKGLIICCPICNFESFRSRSPFINPIDGKNLNSVFPGNPKGTLSEVIAHHLLYDFVAGTDYHIDMHSGDAIEDLYPYVFYHKSGQEETDKKSAWMAELYGLDYIAITESSGCGASDQGNFYATVSELGIPSIQPEAGGLGVLKEEAVQLHYQGVTNILKGLNMLDSGIMTKNNNQTVLKQFIRLKAKNNGILYPMIRPGQKATKGDLLAVITDYRKDKELEKHIAEEDCVILWTMSSPAVKNGDSIMAIGKTT
ncbi:MAG: M14 family metallopeptidase [Peptococcaceae bacterium]|jgi:predicted deacylase|nr:M14 family metallopeptidase [Peptococcaceae bacterium]MDH7526054.1 M14 family metallopeptidase [Peptococcaceae bacterium]